MGTREAREGRLRYAIASARVVVRRENKTSRATWRARRVNGVTCTTCHPARFRGDATWPFTTTIPPPLLLTPALAFPILPRSRPPPVYYCPSCSPLCWGICSLPRSRQLGRLAYDVASWRATRAPPRCVRVRSRVSCANIASSARWRPYAGHRVGSLPPTRSQRRGLDA